MQLKQVASAQLELITSDSFDVYSPEIEAIRNEKDNMIAEQVPEEPKAPKASTKMEIPEPLVKEQPVMKETVEKEPEDLSETMVLPDVKKEKRAKKKNEELQEDIHQAQAIENNMKGIILFFSFVSLIITLLGVYSAITLDTERRQKEVAIRKVNGAGLKQIIILFARTYIYQLVLSATMAFPLCYAILQLWKNMYIVFFNDGPLFWISIFIIVAVITTLTIIFRILKIARTNPAEVIKNE